MAKRENDSFSVKDLMQSFIKENNLSKGMRKLKVEETWREMMGPGVMAHTSSVKLQNKTFLYKISFFLGNNLAIVFVSSLCF